jgi:opacity protein-like surface antigen
MGAIMKRFFAIASVLALATSPAFARDGSDHMGGGDLGAAVSGKTVQGSMRGSGNYTEYYAPDGTLKGNNYSGKWRIDNNDHLCVTYDPDPSESCWHGRIEGNNVTWLKDGNEDGTGVLSDGDNGGYRADDAARR